MSPTPRRVVLAGALALATALTHQAFAQPAAGRPPRVVIVNAGDQPFFRPLREAFLGAMRDLGQAEGKAFELEVLYGRGEPATTAALIREAAASATAVLVVAGLSNARNARDATKTVPVVHYWPGTAEAGALFSHQADIAKNYERAAYYVTRILQGARPADLPVEQPARYEFVLNRRMATSLGVTIPPAILLRADRVID